MTYTTFSVSYVQTFIHEFQSYCVQRTIRVFREVISAVTVKLHLFRTHKFKKGVSVNTKLSEEVLTRTVSVEFLFQNSYMIRTIRRVQKMRKVA
jgi:hypothetical protein